MPTAPPRVLFLHGGPGFSAELERRRFGQQLPVHWWDQPHLPAGTTGAFGVLVDAALAELERLTAARGAPVALLASSFGTYIAGALLTRAPHLIDSAVIVGGDLDLRRAFVRLALAVARMRGDAALESATHEAAERGTLEAYWELLRRLATVPRFHDIYWAPAAELGRTQMNRLADEGPLFDLTTLQAVVSEVLLAPPPLTSGSSPPVRVLLGRHDPIFEESDLGEWQATMPGARIEAVDAGHFIHLELPPEVWLPDVGSQPPSSAAA